MSSALLKSKFLGSKRQVPLLTVSGEPKFRILLVNDPYDRQTFAESKDNWKFYPGLSWQRQQAVLSKYAPFIFFSTLLLSEVSSRWGLNLQVVSRVSVYLDESAIERSIPRWTRLSSNEHTTLSCILTAEVLTNWLCFWIPSTRRKESILSTKRK